MSDFELVLELMSTLVRGEDPITFTAVDGSELRILLAGGVEPRDFEAAVDIWIGTRQNYSKSTDWGYIRTVALRKAAERKLAQSEVV